MILVVLLAVHVLAAVFWVGGLAFALWMLRPAASKLEPSVRLPLWQRTFQRFVPSAGIAVLALLVSGYGMLLTSFGGFAGAPLYVNLMQGVGLVMFLLYGHVYFALWPRFRKAVDGGALPDAARALDGIRRVVAINVWLGAITITIGGTGRYW